MQHRHDHFVTTQPVGHRDHLRVAFAYARRGGVEHAVARSREGLLAAHPRPVDRDLLSVGGREAGVSRRPWRGG